MGRYMGAAAYLVGRYMGAAAYLVADIFTKMSLIYMILFEKHITL